MSKQWLIPFLIMFFSAFAMANDVVLIMGGGSEPVGTDSRFDVGTMNSISAFKQMDYEVDVTFDGDHPLTQERLAEKLGHPVEPLSVKSYNKQLNDIEKRLDNPNAVNALKPGDKLVLILNDHGGLDAKGNLVIATNDGTIAVEKRLKELKQKAESAGVKLGVVVGTCYSGKTISLVNNATDKDVCIIAASQPEQIGSRDFVQGLSQHLKKGQSLEEAYLEARADLGADESDPRLATSSSPIISTPEGITVDKLMAELHFHLQDLTDIETLAETDKDNPNRCKVCEANLRNSSVNAMKVLMAQVKTKLSFCDKTYLHLTSWSILQNSSDNFVNAASMCSNLALLDKLGRLLNSYDKDAQTAANLTNELQTNKIGKELIEFRMSNGGVVPTPRSEIAMHDWENEAVGLGRDAARYTRQMALEKQAMNNMPRYQKLMAAANELEPGSQLHERLSNEAHAMAEIERKLYASFYQQEKIKNGNKSTACRDFKL